jgi:hypothetical protein
MARSSSRHVVPRGKRWAVVPAGAKRASSTHRTQAAATRAAKAALRKGAGGEAVIHGRNARIRASDTIGRRDPFPPRG